MKRFISIRGFCDAYGVGRTRTYDLIAALKSNKPAILAALAQAPPEAEGWRYHFEERAAIREHDGGLSRTDAEAGALADWLARWRAPGAGD